jgi:hypothetical protein
MGAGAVNTSLIAGFPRKDKVLGPVAAVSFRVASRIVNSLGAGVPARSASELDSVRVILFCSSAAQFPSLIELLGSAKIRWQGKSLIFLDYDCPASSAELFRARGASVASMRRSALPKRLIIEGQGASLAFAHRIARSLGVKSIEIDRANLPAFEMALTLGAGALTPLIEQAAILLRQCGVRDAEATRLAASLFEQTARDYARTGRQSWVWYQRAPETLRLMEQLSAVGRRLRKIAGELILFGMDEGDRNGQASREIREAIEADQDPE